MKKLTFRKALAVGLLATITVTSVCSCKKSNLTKEERAQLKELDKLYKDQPVLKDPKTGKPYDFGGIEIIIGDWWSPLEGAESNPAKNKYDEDTRKWHRWLEAKYNFSIKQIGISSWNSHPQNVANICVLGEEENYVLIIDNRSAITGLKSDLYMDLSEVTDVDWMDKKYNAAVRDMMTKGGKTYGCRPLGPEPRTGFFFNKRLLQEANIDPESIYDMQKNGTWTWDAYETIMKAVTRDIDNDGVFDVWGQAHNESEFCNIVLSSNGGSLIEKDENGKLYNNLDSEASLEAIEWARSMYAKYNMPTPEGANWDWVYAAFKAGQTAFLCEQEYYVDNLSDMPDDWGFVVCPKGPRMSDYRCDNIDNIYVIPSCYGLERGSKIAKAFDIYMMPTPGYDDDEAWKDDFYPRFRDARAVDETLALMRTNGKTRLLNLVPGLEQPMYDFYGSVYQGWETPQQALERVRNGWEALIAEANR